MWKRSLFFFLVPAALAACGGEDPPANNDTGVNNGADAGPTTDTGPATDTGPGQDATTGDVDAGTPDSGPPRDGGPGALNGRLPIGTANVMSANPNMVCPGTPMLPTDACYLIAVSGCDGIADTTVRIKVTEPMGQLRGTVVLGNGGPGTGFYETFRDEAINRVLLPLHMMGYRIVQRGWTEPGWLTGPGGGLKLACRGATMYDAIYREIHTAGVPFCVTGQSAGAAEVAYALAHYGLEAYFDGAVPSGGPPLSRIDHGCLGDDDPAWQMQCNELRTCPGGLCTYLGLSFVFLDGSYQTDDCSMRNEAMRQTFLDDSVLNPLADLDYPQTELRFVLGGMDCSEASPQGKLYYESVTSEKSVVVVPNVDHIIPQSAAGADQILTEILDACVLRH